MSDDGLPAAVRLSAAARALDMPIEDLQDWADAATLKTLQVKAGCLRYVPTPELQRLEDEGWRVDWETLLD